MSMDCAAIDKKMPKKTSDKPKSISKHISDNFKTDSKVFVGKKLITIFVH